MNFLKSILSHKLFPWAVILLVVFGAFKVNSWNKSAADKRLAEYERQVSGALTEQERQLQAANHKIGSLQAQLVSQEELSDYWKHQNEETDENFKKFVKKHKLKIKSMDRTIAALKQQIKGGTTTVVVDDESSLCMGIEKCVVKYGWTDPHERFKLYDPNIFEKDNETFESNQIFKIYGEVYEQQDGSLQTRRLVLREVIKNEDGSFDAIDGGKAYIIDSDFRYSNTPDIVQDGDWTDLFKLRGIIVGSVAVLPDSGASKLGGGIEFFSYKNLGINTHTALDFEDISKLEQRLGLAYRPTILNSQLNLAAGISAGTPFKTFLKDYSLNLDIIFYLND